ncbi:hypothetical protein [Mucilaginibacter pocheonensis]|uniref:Uncharacterized protein n=1 Tax=Mucilaginibacter pocheonensis TaxID=398050 RepID=A0ABU1T9T3_9SPHI|nr:hypothetical protein [Mucilaginibacter pocheonensis]MDR6941626.1 hypothetical protein [Mucilaginibacter pocheonensis]
MSLKTANGKILPLFIAVLYFAFSCCYVTRCPGIYYSDNNSGYLVLHKENIKPYRVTATRLTDSKPVPAIILLRPRVIFAKNPVSFAAPFVRFAKLPALAVVNETAANSFFLNHKAYHPANFLATIHSWKI